MPTTVTITTDDAACLLVVEHRPPADNGGEEPPVDPIIAKNQAAIARGEAVSPIEPVPTVPCHGYAMEETIVAPGCVHEFTLPEGSTFAVRDLPVEDGEGDGGA